MKAKQRNPKFFELDLQEGVGTGIGAIIGLAIGIFYGLVLGNLAIGIAVGGAYGMSLGYTIEHSHGPGKKSSAYKSAMQWAMIVVTCMLLLITLSIAWFLIA